jgi:hypothetical protein
MVRLGGQPFGRQLGFPTAEGPICVVITTPRRHGHNFKVHPERYRAVPELRVDDVHQLFGWRIFFVSGDYLNDT